MSQGQQSNTTKTYIQDERTQDHLELARNLLTTNNHQNYQKALKILQKALYLDPTKVETLFTMAAILIRMQRYKEALIYCRKVVAINKQNLFAQILHADCSLRMKKYHLAQQIYERILQKDESNFQAYVGLAQIYEHLESYEKSIKVLEKITQIKPDYTKAWIHLIALYYFYQGNGRQKAMSCFEKLIKFGQRDKQLWNLLEIILMNDGYHQYARRSLQKSLSLYPQNWWTYLKLGITYDKLGYIQDSSSSFKKATTLLFKQTELPLTEIIGKKNEKELSLKDYNMTPFNAKIVFEALLIAVYLKQNKQGDLAQKLQQGLEAKQEYHKLYFAIGNALIELKQLSLAIKWIEKAHQAFPNEFNFLIALANLSIELRQLEKAIVWLNKALKTQTASVFTQLEFQQNRLTSQQIIIEQFRLLKDIGVDKNICFFLLQTLALHLYNTGQHQRATLYLKEIPLLKQVDQKLLDNIKRIALSSFMILLDQCCYYQPPGSIRSYSSEGLQTFFKVFFEYLRSFQAPLQMLILVRPLLSEEVFESYLEKVYFPDLPDHLISHLANPKTLFNLSVFFNIERYSTYSEEILQKSFRLLQPKKQKNSKDLYSKSVLHIIQQCISAFKVLNLSYESARMQQKQKLMMTSSMVLNFYHFKLLILLTLAKYPSQYFTFETLNTLTAGKKVQLKKRLKCRSQKVKQSLKKRKIVTFGFQQTKENIFESEIADFSRILDFQNQRKKLKQYKKMLQSQRDNDKYQRYLHYQMRNSLNLKHRKIMIFSLIEKYLVSANSPRNCQFLDNLKIALSMQDLTDKQVVQNYLQTFILENPSVQWVQTNTILNKQVQNYNPKSSLNQSSFQIIQENQSQTNKSDYQVLDNMNLSNANNEYKFLRFLRDFMQTPRDHNELKEKNAKQPEQGQEVQLQSFQPNYKLYSLQSALSYVHSGISIFSSSKCNALPDSSQSQQFQCDFSSQYTLLHPKVTLQSQLSQGLKDQKLQQFKQLHFTNTVHIYRYISSKRKQFNHIAKYFFDESLLQRGKYNEYLTFQVKVQKGLPLTNNELQLMWKSDTEILNWITCIIRGIQELQQAGIFHADLTIRNTIKVQNNTYKIIDFDSAFKVATSHEQSTRAAFLHTKTLISFMLQNVSQEYLKSSIMNYYFPKYKEFKESQDLLTKIIKIKKQLVQQQYKVESILQLMHKYSLLYHLKQFQDVLRNILSCRECLFNFIIAGKLLRATNNISVHDRQQNIKGYEKLLTMVRSEFQAI